jgi:hypothetical protein
MTTQQIVLELLKAHSQGVNVFLTAEGLEKLSQATQANPDVIDEAERVAREA